MSDEEYGLSKIPDSHEVEPPDYPYRATLPKSYSPKIGLIGAGGITAHHLKAYRRMGLDVAAICDTQIERASERRDEFYPDAMVTSDYQDVLNREDIEVVDIATHPEPRVSLVQHALEAKKHVLSQKPFVLDLEIGRQLVRTAKQNGVKLAVNQNGRWAPHFHYLVQLIEAGIIGDVTSIDVCMQWDHMWTAGTPFEEIHHLILYDFAVHWFDIVTAMMDGKIAWRVFASVGMAAGQTVKPPFLASVIIDYEGTQVRLSFNATVALGQEDRTIVCGTKGTLRSIGPGLNDQEVQVWTEAGFAKKAFDGNWFDDGFVGTMAELLCAIEENREPWNAASSNLKSLQLCFAAIESANRGEAMGPAQCTKLL
ncbi:MAG: Gfo/Idh/MocA family oxidoreductase [Planctomycetales bacterium]|nr:Gfo/Idh/MocA family oxidoreductase [Planctomycetales bacterium]